MNDYPEDFFELFGAIKDDTFIEPNEVAPKTVLEKAVEVLYNDYKNNKNLTAFTSLDYENFYETK